MDPWPFIDAGGLRSPVSAVHPSQQQHSPHPQMWALAHTDDVSQTIAVTTTEQQLLAQAFSRPFGEHHLKPLFMPGHLLAQDAVASPPALRGRHASISAHVEAALGFDATDVDDIASAWEEEIASPVTRPPELRRRSSWGSERDLTHLRPSPSTDDLELSTGPAQMPMEPWRAFYEERISPSSKWIYCMHENGAILKVQVMAGMTGKYVVLEGHEAVETWRRLREVANFERFFPEELRMDNRNPLFLKAEEHYRSCCGHWLFLPQECWKHALMFLDGRSLGHAGLSCHMMGVAFEHSKVRESLVDQVSKQLLATYLTPYQLTVCIKERTKPAQLLAYLHKSCCAIPPLLAPTSLQAKLLCIKRWSGVAKFRHSTINASLLELLPLWAGEMQPPVLPEQMTIKPQEELDVIPSGGHLFQLAAKPSSVREIVAALDGDGLAAHVLHHQCRFFVVSTTQLRQLVQQDGWEELRTKLTNDYGMPAPTQAMPATALPAAWVLYFTPRQPGYYTWM